MISPSPLRRVFLVAVFGLVSCDLLSTEPEAVRLILYVAPHTVECTGEGAHTCLLVREDSDEEWRYFYDEIEGFDYVAGFTYKLSVSRRVVEDPPADGSSFEYRLIEVLERIPAANE